MKDYEEIFETYYYKYLCLNNIRELLKTSDVKVGQIEKLAKCQPGYLSRIEKKDNATEPSLAFLLAAKQLLNVSMDLLLFEDLTEQNTTVNYIISFLRKIEKNTISAKIHWEKESEDYLLHLKENLTIHPLFDLLVDESKSQMNEFDCDYKFAFKSNAFGYKNKINNSWYKYKMSDDITLYIVSVEKRDVMPWDQETKAIELWWYDSDSGKQFFVNDVDNGVLSDIIKELYGIVEKTVSLPTISSKVRALIDSYMNEKE